MIALLKTWWPEILLSLLSVVIGAGVRGIVDRAEIASVRAAMADLKTEHAKQGVRAANASLARLQQANQRADALQAALDSTEQRLTFSQTEKQREIQRHTTGSACLNSRTVRLLNHAAAGNQPANLPPAASGATAEDAAIATDTDVAGWISQAQAHYDTCRARLDALIDWHAPHTLATDALHD